ncbi:Annexin A13 [Gonapodya sp. JEL0774]|nr:Annexin A13 [Gonapodya sp. JEL0774]
MPTTIHEFVFEPKGHGLPAEVALTGTFDGWQRSLPMEKILDDRRGVIFRTEVPVPVGGRLEYKYIVDGIWTVDYSKPLVPSPFGSFNNLLETPFTARRSSPTRSPLTFSHTLIFAPPFDASAVIVTGWFDLWSETVKMEKRVFADRGPVFFKKVELPWGKRIEYKFIADGQSLSNRNNYLFTPHSPSSPLDPVYLPPPATTALITTDVEPEPVVTVTRRGSTVTYPHDGRTEEVFEELDPPPPVSDPSPVSFVGAYDAAPVPPAPLPTKPLVRKPSGATYPHDGRTVTVYEDDSATTRSPRILSDRNIVPPMVVPSKPPLTKSLVRQDSTVTYPHDGRTVEFFEDVPAHLDPSVSARTRAEIIPPLHDFSYSTAHDAADAEDPKSEHMYKRVPTGHRVVAGSPIRPATQLVSSPHDELMGPAGHIEYMVAGTRPKTPPLSGSELRESKAVPVKLDEAKPAVGQTVALGRGRTHSRKFRTGKPMEGATVAGQSRGYFASGKSSGPTDYSLRQHIEQDRNPAVAGARIAYSQEGTHPTPHGKDARSLTQYPGREHQQPARFTSSSPISSVHPYQSSGEHYTTPVPHSSPLPQLTRTNSLPTYPVDSHDFSAMPRGRRTSDPAPSYHENDILAPRDGIEYVVVGEGAWSPIASSADGQSSEQKRRFAAREDGANGRKIWAMRDEWKTQPQFLESSGPRNALTAQQAPPSIPSKPAYLRSNSTDFSREWISPAPPRLPGGDTSPATRVIVAPGPTIPASLAAFDSPVSLKNGEYAQNVEPKLKGEHSAVSVGGLNQASLQVLEEDTDPHSVSHVSQIGRFSEQSPFSYLGSTSTAAPPIEHSQYLGSEPLVRPNLPFSSTSTNPFTEEQPNLQAPINVPSSSEASKADQSPSGKLAQPSREKHSATIFTPDGPYSLAVQDSHEDLPILATHTPSDGLLSKPQLESATTLGSFSVPASQAADRWSPAPSVNGSWKGTQVKGSETKAGLDVGQSDANGAPTYPAKYLESALDDPESSAEAPVEEGRLEVVKSPPLVGYSDLTIEPYPSDIASLSGLGSKVSASDEPMLIEHASGSQEGPVVGPPSISTQSPIILTQIESTPPSAQKDTHPGGPRSASPSRNKKFDYTLTEFGFRANSEPEVAGVRSHVSTPSKSRASPDGSRSPTALQAPPPQGQLAPMVPPMRTSSRHIGAPRNDESAVLPPQPPEKLSTRSRPLPDKPLPRSPSPPKPQSSPQSSSAQTLVGHNAGHAKQPSTSTVDDSYHPPEPLALAVKFHDAIAKHDHVKAVQIITSVTPDQVPRMAQSFASSYRATPAVFVRPPRVPTGPFAKVLEALTYDAVEYEVRQLHDACGYWVTWMVVFVGEGCAGTDVNSRILTEKCTLIGILVGRSNQEIQAMKQLYQRLYKKDLAVKVLKEVGPDLSHLFARVVKASRVEVGSFDVGKDVEALYQAGEAKWGTNESVFIDILTTRPLSHLKQVADAYLRLYGHTLSQVVDSEFGTLASGTNLNAAMRLLVKSATEEQSEVLADRFYESMKGLGHRESKLIRLCVVYRAPQPIMKNITSSFYHRYKKTLASWIEEETSGDYRIALHACIGYTPGVVRVPGALV